LTCNNGVWQGIPPKGNSVNIPHLDIFESVGDKIEHLTTYTDMATIMIQVGAASAPDMPDFTPSIQLPDPEPMRLSPLQANAEAIARWNSHDMASYAKILYSDCEISAGPVGVKINRDQ
jgi:hypothetical protein